MWLSKIGHENEILLNLNEIFKGRTLSTCISSKTYTNSLSNNPFVRKIFKVVVMGKHHLIIDMFLYN